MKRVRWIPTFLYALLTLVAGPLAGPLVAQEREEAADSSSRSSRDEATIRSLEKRERRAVLEQDFGELERLWSPEYMVNSPMNRIAPDRATVLEIFRQGLARYSSFERGIEEIRFRGDIAIVMGSETVEPIGNAPLAGQRVERRFTNIWEREGDTWRMIARHANNVTSSEASPGTGPDVPRRGRDPIP